jgi:hypothetical protein
VVAHETTHALVDGLRGRYSDPSSPDQAAFHEGFSDVVALLSVFALRDVVKAVLDRGLRQAAPPGGGRLVHQRSVHPDALRQSLLLGLAEEMGQEISSVRGQALRRSVTLEPSPAWSQDNDYLEPHRRGEILVAAMMNAFLGVWTRRLESLGRIQGVYLDRERIAEEAADAADYLLTMSIRALDYTPPVHVEFPDFLSALLTADREIRPDDSKYRFRRELLESFCAFGIEPSSATTEEEGLWRPPEGPMAYDRIHFEAMCRDRDEVFRFVWENRKALGLFAGAYTRVETLRPCVRTAPDGFPLKETVAECTQQLELAASELLKLGIRKPHDMPDDTTVKLQGGITLIFDDRGTLKFAISNKLADPKKPETQRRQSVRLQYLWDFGYFAKGSSLNRRLSVLHRMRAMNSCRSVDEEW